MKGLVEELRELVQVTNELRDDVKKETAIDMEDNSVVEDVANDDVISHKHRKKRIILLIERFVNICQQVGPQPHMSGSYSSLFYDELSGP